MAGARQQVYDTRICKTWHRLFEPIDARNHAARGIAGTGDEQGRWFDVLASINTLGISAPTIIAARSAIILSRPAGRLR